jgi:hypothetical protein
MLRNCEGRKPMCGGIRCLTKYNYRGVVAMAGLRNKPAPACVSGCTCVNRCTWNQGLLSFLARKRHYQQMKQPRVLASGANYRHEHLHCAYACLWHATLHGTHAPGHAGPNPACLANPHDLLQSLVSFAPCCSCPFSMCGPLLCVAAGLTKKCSSSGATTGAQGDLAQQIQR